MPRKLATDASEQRQRNVADIYTRERARSATDGTGRPVLVTTAARMVHYNQDTVQEKSLLVDTLSKQSVSYTETNIEFRQKDGFNRSGFLRIISHGKISKLVKYFSYCTRNRLITSINFVCIFLIT